MKIKNISEQELKIAFILNGKTTIIPLKPGHIIYSEKTSIDSKQLLIFQKKRLIESNDDDKPAKGIYYHPYPTIKRTSSNTTVPMFEDVYDEVDEVEEKSTDIIIPLIASDDDDDAEIDEDKLHKVSEAVLGTSVKNKGGRPPGAKNKPKRGRKKGAKVKSKVQASVEVKPEEPRPGSDIDPYDDWE